MATPKYLVRSDNGRIFAYTAELSRRSDMIDAIDLDEAYQFSAKRGGPSRPSRATAADQAHEEAHDEGHDEESDDFVISTASKDELEHFAREHFSVELDKRKKISDLRAEVMTLAQADEGESE